MTFRHHLLTAAALLALAGCDSTPKLAKPYPFDVVVALTPAADVKLKQTKSRITIYAHYYGLATPASAAKANAVGQIALGDENLEVSGPARIHFAGSQMDSGLIADVGNTPYVLLTGSSEAVDGGDDPKIICMSPRASIRDLQTNVPTINCELASEYGQ